MSRFRVATLLAAGMAAASLGVGAWKVREVRTENARLAVQARECVARNDAFLSLLREADRRRRGIDQGGGTP